jgi:allantoinase
VSFNPAQRFGLFAKADIAPGYDADIVLVDPAATFVLRAAESESHQGYTPFEGMELTTRKYTFLRGSLIYGEGKVLGPARGLYLHRPQARSC